MAVNDSVWYLRADTEDDRQIWIDTVEAHRVIILNICRLVQLSIQFTGNIHEFPPVIQGQSGICCVACEATLTHRDHDMESQNTAIW